MPWSTQIRTTRATLGAALAAAHAGEHPAAGVGQIAQMTVAGELAEAAIDRLTDGLADAASAEFTVTLSGHAGADSMVDGDHLTVTVSRGPFDPAGLLR